MSSGGILFTTDQPPSGQERLEVTVNWPVALEGRCPLKLVTVGRVVRTDGLRVAVRIDRYEFKTRGAEPPAPASVAAAERETT